MGLGCPECGTLDGVCDHMRRDMLRPMNVDCGKCSHTWAIAYMPMEVSKLVSIMKNAKCPMCGAGSSHVFINTSGRMSCDG